MVEMEMVYEGQLHCQAKHGPSGTVMSTDAPKDNMGRGEAFSPTDLVAAALGTCILTTMGIVAQRNNIDMAGATAKVTKEMVAQPVRRIGRITVKIHMPRKLSDDDQRRLENAAQLCPVKKSLHQDVEVPIEFVWG
ncbi:MAG: OsmC family protein [Tepidisphaerales bacterium]